MQPIASSLEGRESTFGQVRQALAPEGFTLANWEYDRGFFDKQLDDKAMVYLRLPFEVTEGELDNAEARIRFGTPFVLKHVYQTGNDPTIGYFASQTVAPLVNQFQEPVDKDAPVDPFWAEQAKRVVRRVESLIG